MTASISAMTTPDKRRRATRSSPTVPERGDRGQAPARTIDHRKGPRRRGELLFQAIFEATLAELSESGYSALRMERVAARARTSKASLYSRWPSRAELVVAAIEHAAVEDVDLADTGSLRGDLLALLRQMADRLAGPFGEAVRGLMAETLADPERTQAARARLAGARNRRLQELVARAATRGEIAPGGLSPWVIDATPALLAHWFLTHGAPIPADVIAGIVDHVSLPLLGATASAGQATAGSLQSHKLRRRK